MTLPVRCLEAGTHAALVGREGLLYLAFGLARFTDGDAHLATFADNCHEWNGDELIIASTSSTWRFRVLDRDR